MRQNFILMNETINWSGVEELGYRRASRLRKIEHALVCHPDGLTSEQLRHEAGLPSTESGTRILQKDLHELRKLYIGKQEITRTPHRLLLKGGNLAFPEAEFETRDRKQLNAIAKVLAFFDGAIPIKSVLKVSLSDVADAMKGVSSNIDTPTVWKEVTYIKEIFEAIENRQVLDIVYPRLNAGKVFSFAPYLLKRFNNKWFVIGRMYIDNPFDWTLIPLAAISILNQHKGNNKYIPKYEWEITELKERIRSYYDKVIGYHVPTNETDPDKVPRHLSADTLMVEKIEIKCSSNKLHFIKENPIHPKQNVDEERGMVTLDVVINPLLIQRILGFGSDVEVIGPDSLRNSMREIISNMNKIYQPI